jgi:hypothetical protein
MREALDELLRKRIISRGLILKCQRCRHTAFHPTGLVSEVFTCIRCSTEQEVNAMSWCDLPPHEPSWFYRLDEVAYQALNFDVRVPALALAELGADQTSARYGWSFELVRDGHRVHELDFICLVDGHLAAGEAKVNGDLGSGKAAIREALKTTDAAALVQADEVVFATTQQAWKPSALTAIEATRTAWGQPRLRLMQGLA